MTENPFRRILQEADQHPPEERAQAVTELVGKTIPFVGTAGLHIDTYTPTRVVAQLSDQTHVHNHIGGLHAAAMALLVETVTGLVVALNVPPESTPVIRSLDIDFQKRAEGSLRGEATLTSSESERIQSKPIGKIDVPVTVADTVDQAPIMCDVKWAWLPKDRVLR